MDIVRNADGTLVVPVEPERRDDSEDAEVDLPKTTRTLHPGEGGYEAALAAWDLQQNPEREAALSTADGRQEAMAVVHAVAASPDHAVAPAVAGLDDPQASVEALRHVLVGGVHSVEAFAAEIAESEGGTPLPAHQATKIIGEVLAELE